LVLAKVILPQSKLVLMLLHELQELSKVEDGQEGVDIVDEGFDEGVAERALRYVEGALETEIHGILERDARQKGPNDARENDIVRQSRVAGNFRLRARRVRAVIFKAADGGGLLRVQGLVFRRVQILHDGSDIVDGGPRPEKRECVFIERVCTSVSPVNEYSRGDGGLTMCLGVNNLGKGG
jgi:hypothetical protein